MSEGGVQVGIARARSGAVATTRTPAVGTMRTPAVATTRTPAVPRASGLAAGQVDETAVRAALMEVMDPELPMLSVVDLGIIHRVAVATGEGSIRVEILPTFVGCPALELIKASIATRLGAFGRPVEVTATFEVPWTSDRISPAGRRALLDVGIAPPSGGDPVRAAGDLIDLAPRVPCPHCGSRQTSIENLFGPTQCRTIRYCTGCRQPFESIKQV